MNENPDLDQKYCSRTATGIYKIGDVCTRLMKWMV